MSFNEVGVNAFALSLGVALEAEPKLVPTIEQLYRQCTETVSRARLVAARGGDPSIVLNNNNNISNIINNSSGTVHHSNSLPAPTHEPKKQTDQFKRSPSKAQQQQHYSPDSEPAPKPQEPVATSSITVTPIAAADEKTQKPQQQQQQQQPPQESKRVSPAKARSPSMAKNDDDYGSQRNLNAEFSRAARGGAGDSSSHSSAPSYFGYNDDVLGYARFIGIDPDVEPFLLPIAKEGLFCSLPPEWQKQKSRKDGATYYYNTVTGDTTWEHPLDEEFRRRVADARADRKRRNISNLMFVNSTAGGMGNNNNNNTAHSSRASSAASGSTRFVTMSDLLPNNNNSIRQNNASVSPSRNYTASSSNTNNNNMMMRRSQSPSSIHNNSNSNINRTKDVEDRVEAFAEHIGIDPVTERHLLPIAREALLAPLPPNYKSYTTEDGFVYYCNSEDESTSWDHPMLSKFKTQVQRARRQQQQQQASNNNNNNPRPPSPNQRKSHHSQTRGSTTIASSANTHQQLPHQVYAPEVLQYAKFLGVDPDLDDGELMSIVVEGFQAPLPNGWSSYQSAEDGTVYYANAALQKSSYDHPLDEIYRHRISDARIKLSRRAVQ